MQNDNAIVVKGLTKSFKQTKVLDGIDLTVEKGTMLALLGPNGAGKTTIVRILSTLLRPDGGEALVNGYSVNTEAQQVRESIGLTGQYAAVDDLLTGYENLEMMGRLYHLSPKDAKHRAHELLEQFDLVDAKDRRAKTYSGGMRRRLDLAASLIATPPIVFLDEPTTGLDPRSRATMWSIIKKLVEADVTILLTTQYLEEADQLADKIAVIDGGKVIAEGTAEQLKQKVGKERLELVFKSEDILTQASNIIRGEALQIDQKRKAISIAVNEGVREIKQVLDQLSQSSIDVETLSLHKPTLDDVFMQLTGHDADQSNDEGEVLQ